MINYYNLHAAQDFYSIKGFQRIEAPWTVTKAISQITKPVDKEDFELEKKKKVLVASGEQSFLYLYLKGYLPLGSFQTITPCFREDVFDVTHSKYFMKNELIETKDVSPKRLVEVVEIAADFMSQMLNAEVEIKKISAVSYDIEYAGIELGSYGYRECDFLNWIYGTGIAEPRFSHVQNLIKNGRLPQTGDPQRYVRRG